MNMELTKVKLSDVARVEISGVDKKSKPGQKSVRLCNFVDVYHNWAITQDMRDSFMEATASDKEIEALSIKKGQVAFTKDSETRDDIGIPTYIADDFDDVVLGYHNALITPDERKLNGKYLNAFMHSSYIQKYFENNASGSGQRYTLSNDTVNSIPILLPTIKEQEKIGNLFSFIDRKIALNKKMNQKLEAMAKRLYDYWFVQYDFPDKNGHPYKTTGGPMTYNPTLKREIPAGWEVKKCSEICRILTGKEDANFASGNGKFKFFTCSSEPSLCDKAAFEGHAVLIAGNGDFNVKHYSGKFNAYQRTYVLIPPDKYYAMLYIAALERIDSFKSGSNGSIVKFITKGDVENICVFDGAPAILYSVINNLIFQYEKISLEIEKLSLFRNKLLPLLMNGQVTVA